MQEKSKRVRRMAELIQSVIADLLKKEVNDPRLKQVSVTGVDLSPDYGKAVIFFTMLDANDESIKEAERAFKKAAGFLRYSLSQGTDLRYTPNLIFQYDATLANAERVSRLINEDGRA